MIVCKICGKRVKNVAGLISHLRTHDITYEEYKKIIEVKKEKCKICGKEFENISVHVREHGFSNYDDYVRFCTKHKQEITMLNRYRNKPYGKLLLKKFKIAYGIKV